MYCFINFNRKRKKEFVTINNLIELLAQLKNMRYNVREINKKRQAVESGNSLQPYAGAYTSHTADYCAFLIISTFLFNRKGNLWKRRYYKGSCLLYFCGARESNPAPLFYLSLFGGSLAGAENFSVSAVVTVRRDDKNTQTQSALLYTMRRHCAAPFLIPTGVPLPWGNRGLF